MFFGEQLTGRVVSFTDGAALWAYEPGEHLLHERHRAVSAVRARAQDCAQEVAFLLQPAQHVDRNLARSC